MNRAAHIVNTLLETDEFDPEEIVADTAKDDEINRERSRYEIQNLVPGFFDRSQNRFFGTSKTRYFKGNFVVVTNRRRGSQGYTSTDHVIYKLVYYKDSDQWDLKFVASFNTNELVRAFVKAARSNPDLTEEEFREQYLGPLGRRLL